MLKNRMSEVSKHSASISKVTIHRLLLKYRFKGTQTVLARFWQNKDPCASEDHRCTACFGYHLGISLPNTNSRWKHTSTTLKRKRAEQSVTRSGLCAFAQVHAALLSTLQGGDAWSPYDSSFRIEILSFPTAAYQP